MGFPSLFSWARRSGVRPVCARCSAWFCAGLVESRRNGPTGKLSLLFNRRTTRFLDIEVGY